MRRFEDTQMLQQHFGQSIEVSYAMTPWEFELRLAMIIQREKEKDS